MQPNKLESTKQYDRFIFKTGNRPVRGRVASLMVAIEKHNQLQEYPILVSENGKGLLEIADGQHRFAAAKALGLPIFYIRSRQTITIEQIAAANALQKSWNLNDWMESWIARGNAEYAKLRDFCKTFHVPITVGLEILASSYGGEQGSLFKAGKFKVRDIEFGQTVGHTLGALRSHVPTNDLRLIRALIRVLRVPGISIDRLIKKVVTHSSIFERQATWMRYVELLEKLYNQQARTNDRLALVFEVDKIERVKRSKTISKGNRTRKEKEEAK